MPKWEVKMASLKITKKKTKATRRWRYVSVHLEGKAWIVLQGDRHIIRPRNVWLGKLSAICTILADQGIGSLTVHTDGWTYSGFKPEP